MAEERHAVGQRGAAGLQQRAVRKHDLEREQTLLHRTMQAEPRKMLPCESAPPTVARSPDNGPPVRRTQLVRRQASASAFQVTPHSTGQYDRAD